VAGLSKEDFDRAAKEVQEAWGRAQSRDEGFQVIVDFGRKYGYKNVIAAIQGRMPKQFDREKPVEDWVEERKQEESRSG
jgi:hypothetical protein